MGRPGFTLVELLVTMAIISLLASMLAPALSRSREQVRMVSCMNNLRQMGSALFMYAHDNDDYVIPYHGASGRYFNRYVVDILGVKYPVPGSWAVKDNVPKMLFCPSDKAPYQAAPPAGDIFGSYGWNRALSGVYNDQTALPFHKLGEAVAPANTVIGAETTPSILVKDTTTFDFTIHGTGVNVLFLDGHVSFVAPADVAKLKYTMQ
ncbi:MAG: DUF1559 domain-containing protein [Verrucomicrobiae bacterium]|nr:DUF1559 domain-containing protein [Verrucomicrobiae bacterium]